MRYIDLAKVKEAIEAHDDKWFAKAEQAFIDIEALIDAGSDKKAISKAIDKYAPLWQSIKDALGEVSHRKCWYCESREDRSDNAVDHYRPKKQIAELGDEQLGYWWLAFSWKNYRFACTYCNSHRKDKLKGTTGGKHHHFPIWDEAKRACDYSDDVALDEEQPLLLDPTRRSDPILLWFDEDGLVRPNPQFASTEKDYLHEKAITSIHLYHLNHAGIVERRLMLFREIIEDLESAKKCLDQYGRGNQAVQSSLDDALERLRKKLREDSVNSGAARTMLLGLRTQYPLVEAILQ